MGAGRAVSSYTVILGIVYPNNLYQAKIYDIDR
jgi:hypothetical protein